jgi:hypothetical protein
LCGVYCPIHCRMAIQRNLESLEASGLLSD